jgi:hypothetical protein
MARIVFESKVIPKSFVELFGRHSLLETSMKVLDIRAWCNLGKKVFTDGRFLGNSGQCGFEVVVLENGPICIQLDCAKGKEVNFFRRERVDLFKERALGSLLVARSASCKTFSV